MIQLFLLVVVYNKQFNESSTLKHIVEFEDKKNIKKVIVIDNSTINNDVENKCKDNNWKYISENKNLGISKAYNLGIKYIQKNFDLNYSNILIFLDDDTDISNQYLNNVISYATKNKLSQIFMPIIKDNNGKIVSPSKYTKIRNIPLKDKKQCFKLTSKNILAINSCLAVRTVIFKDYKFDENLFLDYIDSQFFSYVRVNNINFDVIDYEIKHDFFTHSNKDYKKEIARRKVMIKDYKYYVSNKTFLEKILFNVRVLFWKVRGSIEFKNIDYFKDF